MITETEFSALATKDIPRKEKNKDNDSRFQDIFSALTAALQTPNTQNSLSNGWIQNNGTKTAPAVREITQNKSGQNPRDIDHNRLDQKNKPKERENAFANNLRDTQANSTLNDKPGDRPEDNVQTLGKERASSRPVSRKDSKPEAAEDQEETVKPQDSGVDENAKNAVEDHKEAEPDLKELARVLQGLADNTSNAQGVQGNDASPQLLALLTEQGARIEDLLIKAGMSATDAKNLLDQVQAQIENSLQVRAALKGDLSGIKMALPTDTTANTPAHDNATSAEDTTSPFSAENLAKTLITHATNGNTGLPSKPDGKDSAKDFTSLAEKGKDSAGDSLPVADNSMEALERILSSSQSNQASSVHTSNTYNNDANAQNLLQVSRDVSEASVKFSEPVKATPNSPAHNVSADLAAKPLGEIKQALSPQEVIHRGTVDKPVIDQILEKFSLRGTGPQNEINIKLSPPDLGTVRINIISDGDHVKTTLIADSHAVKQTIESNLGQLRDSMADQGLKVQSFTVLVGGNQGHKGQNPQHQQGATYLPGTPEGSNRQENGEPVVARRQRIFDKSQSISIFA